MPEVGFSNEIVKVAKAIKKEASKTEMLMPDEIQDIFSRLKGKGEIDLEWIGDGAECVVMKDGEGAMLAAINYADMPANQMKQQFYAQRIVSILFPHNFPHFYAAFGKHPDRDDQKNITGTLRELVSQNGKKTEAFGSYYFSKFDRESKYKFTEVAKTVTDLELPLDFDMDGHNFGIGEDGGVYYLDAVRISGQWPTVKLLDYMADKGFSKREIYVVKKSIERLDQLEKEKWLTEAQAEAK